uniref:Glycoprotein n=1 Tax=Human cytomegalovirus TaxID=10359 RepID=A7X8Y7_HCMV|nr:glycoprotein [Human betaherpesvirus 5]
MNKFSNTRIGFTCAVMAPRTLILTVGLLCMRIRSLLCSPAETTVTTAAVTSAHGPLCPLVFQGWAYAVYHQGDMALMTLDVYCCRQTSSNTVVAFSHHPADNTLLIEVGNNTRRHVDRISCQDHFRAQHQDCPAQMVHVRGVNESAFGLTHLQSCCLNEHSQLSERVAYHLKLRPATFGLETWAMYTVGILALGSFSSFYSQIARSLGVLPNDHHYALKKA